MSDPAFHFLILAGGGGTRLWPASRRSRPKQFLPLLPEGPGGPGSATLLGATVERLMPLAGPDRIWVITAAAQLDAVNAAAPSLRPDRVVLEVEARNTAPCIGLGAVAVARVDPDAVCAVIPSDQFVGKPEPYRAALERALEAAKGGQVVTIGIQPSGPETGFGYIERGSAESSPGVFAVERFVEKPDRPTAEGYLRSGRYLWNSGMFFFSVRTIRNAISALMPDLGALLAEIEADPSSARAVYPKAPKISIDYGVMERLGKGKVSVVPGDFGWNDIGSWTAIGETRTGDAADNVSVGDSVTVDARGNILYAEGKRVIGAVGVSNLVIVATEDAVLVLPKERAQDVREIVAALEKSKREAYL
jgi:mannose-1-phosphate guanylyltransferase